MHSQYPKPIGWSIDPYFMRSDLHYPFLIDDFSSWCDSLSSYGCTRIHIVLSSLRSILKHFFLLGSSWANIGDNITPSFNCSNRVIKCGVTDSVGIVFCKWRLQIFLSGFNMISKYEEYLNKRLENFPLSISY